MRNYKRLKQLRLRQRREARTLILESVPVAINVTKEPSLIQSVLGWASSQFRKAAAYLTVV